MRRLTYAIGLAAAALTIWTSGCRGDSDNPTTVSARLSVAEQVRAVIDADSVSHWLPTTMDMPDGSQPLKICHVGRYADVFNDSNHVHWAAAAPAALAPIGSTRDFWNDGSALEKIVSCEDFHVDEMNYSSPYLVPAAARMVHEIGRRFRDTLRARGGGDYRIKVTSALRTPLSIKRLHRVNANSVDSSTHLLGTTVDISYARFICDNPATPHSVDQLKGILAEVLYKMREEGSCVVKFEAKQPCFHISLRHSGTNKQSNGEQ